MIRNRLGASARGTPRVPPAAVGPFDAGPARYHDTTFDPVLLVQGNDAPGGPAIDVSGNGFDVALTTGAGFRVPMCAGESGPILGYWFDVDTFYTMGGGAGSAGNNALRITGDITIEWFGYWNFDLDFTASRVICSFGLAGVDADNNNNIYGPRCLLDEFQTFNFHENGVGTNVNAPTQLACPDGLHHNCVVRRIAGGVASYEWFSDGQLVSTVGGLLVPEGSSNGIFKFGADHTELNRNGGAVASLKIIAGDLTAADVAFEYNRTLGPRDGIIT